MARRDVAREAFYQALQEDDPASLYDHAPCGYLSTTPDGTIVKVNETFLTWTDYRREELVGLRRFVDLLSPGGRVYHETHYAPMLLMQGSVREIALDLVKEDGERLPVLVNANLGKDADGNPVVVRVALFDASERREYERELVRAKERAEESEERARALARTLQENLIPPVPPDIPGLDVAAAFRPAGSGIEVGGDFYDVFEIGRDDWVVVLGDVCGKGVGAAVITALARFTLRAVVVGLRAPSEAFRALNDVLIRHETDKFCTVTMVRLRRDDSGWTATLGSAGHPLPILAHEGEAPRLVGGSGSLLGILPNPAFQDVELRLRPGDALVLYTDGVTEGRRDGEFFGEVRLLACVAGHSGTAGEMVRGVIADVAAFQREHLRDDVAVVTVRVPLTGSEG